MSRKGLETIIVELAPSEPKAKQAKPDDFVDHRFVSQLEKEGFIKCVGFKQTSRGEVKGQCLALLSSEQVRILGSDQKGEELNMPNVKLPTGVDLYYESHGQGEPLIFVPSTAFSGEVWKPSQMPLAQSLNIVFHDPRGCGRSIAAQHVYTIEQMAADIVALMDHLKIPSAHLLGHSMGGRIALCSDAKLSGTSKELDYGRQRLGSCGAGRL